MRNLFKDCWNALITAFGFKKSHANEAQSVSDTYSTSGSSSKGYTRGLAEQTKELLDNSEVFAQNTGPLLEQAKRQNEWMNWIPGIKWLFGDSPESTTQTKATQDKPIESKRNSKKGLIISAADELGKINNSSMGNEKKKEAVTKAVTKGVNAFIADLPSQESMKADTTELQEQTKVFKKKLPKKHTILDSVMEVFGHYSEKEAKRQSKKQQEQGQGQQKGS